MSGRLSFAVAALLGALALVASGCAHEENEPLSADDWADTYCSMVGSWVETSRSADGVFAAGEQSVRADLEQAVETIDVATATLSDGLDRLGSPDVTGGKAADLRAERLAADLSARVDTMSEALDEGDDAPFPAIAAFGTEMEAAGADVVEATDEISRVDPELRAAFDASGACQEFKDDLT